MPRKLQVECAGATYHTRRKAISAMLALSALSAAAVTRHVDLSNISPMPPFTNWVTAATNIQEAIDAAVDGDLVLVTNGVYQIGGKSIAGLPVINRVAVDKAITVASVNGPEVTTIQGIVTGRTPVRCAYLTNGAVLAGFTLTNGSVSLQTSGAGGGVYCQSDAATVTNCTLVRNSGTLGGGGYQGTLLNCILAGNAAASGGGAYQATLYNCVIITNSSTQGQGGASGGGGVAQSTLNNCTLTGNSAYSSGGGAFDSTLNNCTVYYNSAPSGSNYSGGSLNFCCTLPLPGGGSGNFTNEPQFSSTFHISAASPCRGAGSAAYAIGADLDGELWQDPPSVGCDEYVPGGVTGPLAVSIAASYTNFTPGIVVSFAGTIAGKASACIWDFGDEVRMTNVLQLSHAWTSSGNYPVVLTAYNEDYPDGVSATQVVQVAAQIIFYVAQDSTNAVAPYTNWSTAAQDIQSALDLAILPGQWVLVSNGVYNTGGRLAANTTNRVAVQRATRLVSLNGPEVTIIEGQRATSGGIGAGAVRCVYLAGGAVLDGFTLRNGSTETYSAGGGVYASFSAIITNCELRSNYGAWGAGAFSGTFNRCTFQNNSSYSEAGAAYSSTLNNCNIIGNVAEKGGGTWSCTVNNCTLASNYGVQYGGGAGYSTLNNCILDHNNADYGAGTYYGTANNCVYTNNYAYRNGGGIHHGTANNCLLINNAGGDPVYPETGGGAAYFGTLNSCKILGNNATSVGGGTLNSTVNNCILTGNSALYGGGANGGTLRNCTITGNSGFFVAGGVINCTVYNSIIHYNTQAFGTNNYDGANTFSYCCTTPDPGSGLGNITNEPAFADIVGEDLHLQPNSPCINSGNNSLISANTDLDGNLRIAGGTVDMGPYEFQAPSSMLSYAWLQQYGLPADGSEDFIDPDGDGHNNWQEWRTDTIPTNVLSVLRIINVTNSTSGLDVTWQSVSTRSYFVQRSTNLVAAPVFQSLATNIPGTLGTTTYIDASATNGGPYFYRVGVP